MANPVLMNSVPKHWEIKKLGEVCEIKNGKNQKGVINPIGKYPIYGSAGVMGFANEFLCEAGTTIVGRKGTINKPIFVNTQFWNVDTAFGFSPFTELLDSKFLFFFCQSFNFHKLDKSTTIPSLAKSDLLKIEIILPPLPEQQAIVAKIEELLSELENGKQQLLTAQQQLKVYRQSLLKWAFEGRLTNKDVKDGELPKGWKWVKLNEVLESVKNGSGSKPDDIGETKILRISSVRPNLVDLTEVRYLENDLSTDYEVVENDLLFTRYNGTKEFVGVCGRVPNLIGKLFYPDKLIRCRPKIKEHFHSKYLQYASNCGESRKFILSKLKTTAGQTGIAGSEIKQMPLPISPIKEQQLIVSELEGKLTVCDKIEETITQSLQQTETLRQSILKKAFEGKLI